MSDTTNPTSADTNPGQAVGSTQDVEIRQEVVEQSLEGSGSQEPETVQEKVSQTDEAARLRAELDQVSAERERMRQVLDTIDSDPEASREARRVLEGRPKTQEVDPIQALVKKKFSKLDMETVGRENGPWTEAMTELANLVREQTLAEVETRVGKRFNEIDRTLSGNRFERGLTERGVDVDAPEFQGFMKTQMRDPKFRALHNDPRSVEVASELAALRWKTSQTERQANGSERARLDMAKGGRLNSGSPRGGATSVTSPRIDRYDPQRAEKLIDLAFRKGVRPSDIEFIK